MSPHSQGASPAADPAAAGGSPVCEQARVGLDRLARRWRELPLERAQAGMPLVRALLDHLADGAVVPDLGPGVVVDQLAVLVWDAYAAGRGAAIPERLAGLRRAVS